MSNADFHVLSENYKWDVARSEIVHTTNKTSRPDTDYTSKVDVYEDRVKTWFLNLAQEEMSKGTSPFDYVAVSIGLAYIEGVEQYRRGESSDGHGKPGSFFKASARRIFPQASNAAIDKLWKAVRCGLFHLGFTKGPIIVSHVPSRSALQMDGRHLMIHPARFVDAIIQDFDSYIKELRQKPKGKLAKNFDKLWTAEWNAS
jgi:hypothetical protein